MVLFDPTEYRIPGLVTIALYDDFNPARLSYVVYDTDYEEKIESNTYTSERDLVSVMTRLELRNFLRLKLQLYQRFPDRWDEDMFRSVQNFIYDYGGINLNPDNGGWKPFIPLNLNYD